VANLSSGTVSVLLGNGNGTLQSQQTFGTAGVWPSAVSAVDVNGDGNIDLAVTNYASGSVSVLPGNGDGVFQNPLTFAVGSKPIAITVTDLNRDGKPDIAVTNTDASASSVGVLLGNGNGTFQPQATFAAGLGPHFIAVADVNGDGVPDLLVPNYQSNNVSVLLGDVPPVVLSINRFSPPGPQTSDTSVTFAVTFSKAVGGVDAGDFALAPSGVMVSGPLVASPGSSSVYTVTASGISGTGTLGVNLIDNGSITDAAGNPLQPGAVAQFQAQRTFASGSFAGATGDSTGTGKPILSSPTAFPTSSACCWATATAVFSRSAPLPWGHTPTSWPWRISTATPGSTLPSPTGTGTA
jgi:VCBS repeat protein